MGLAPGTRLGPYEILAPLGAGGMGAVYEARDGRLGRRVAVKVLADGALADARCLCRFEREARAAAALNHPNILDVHDVGQHEGQPYVVSELLEGRTLRACLEAEGRLPLSKALELALQIARGLAAAHEKSIVHRDLKPENLFVTSDGRAKILDFGLARQDAPDAASPAGSQESTASWVSDPGARVGTVGYMSPEQVRGEVVDHRTDIFAFGAVVYEMLSGRRAFQRPTAADTLAAILHEDAPDLCTGEPWVPPAPGYVVRRCLEKQRGDRFQSMRDVAFALEALSTTSLARPPAAAQAGATAPPRPRTRWRVAALALLGASLSALWWVTRGRSDGLPTWTPRQLTSDPGWEDEPALSPDGSLVAFSSDRSGNPDIWLVDAGGRTLLQLTDDPAADRSPAWFPDGSALAFVSDRGGVEAIWKVPKLGGSAVLLVPDGVDPAVSPDGKKMAFARAAKSGNLQVAVAPLDDPSRVSVLTGDDDGLWDHRDPAWSPDGATLCYADFRDLWLVPSAGGRARRLTREHATDAQPVWSPDGRHIYFSSERDGARSLWRLAVDGSDALRLTAGTGPEGHPSLSAAGRRLAYSTFGVNPDVVIVDRRSGQRVAIQNARREEGPDIAGDRTRMVFSSDRDGTFDLWVQPLEEGTRPRGAPVRLTDQPGSEALPRFSPDGRWIAYGGVLAEQRDIWIMRASGGPPNRFTQHPAVDMEPAWSPDGARLAFVSNRGGTYHIWVAAVVNGAPAGEATMLTSGEANDLYPAWSPDGAEIAFIRADGTTWDVWIVPSDGGSAPRRHTRCGNVKYVRWDPTGPFLLVSVGVGVEVVSLRRVSVTTGQMTPLTQPVVMGSAGALGLFGVSADGHVVVFAAETVAGDVWLLQTGPGTF